jgi:acetoin utilization deacetylase AcuC-like enzyme
VPRKKETVQQSSPTGSVNHLTGYVFEDAFMSYELDFGHPECPERLAAIGRRMETTGLAKRVTRLAPLTGVVPHIRTIHTDAHVKAIQGLRTIGPVAELAVGGTLAAVKAVCEGAVRNAFCAVRPPGHHSLNTGQEEGFCFYNNAAIAAKYAQDVCNMPKVLIVDWDFHHGNGTEASFYDDPSVLYFSTHYALAYPGTGYPEKQGKGRGLGFNINVNMPCGAVDDDFVGVCTRMLVPRADAFKPDFVLVSAGFDGHANDKLGCFDMSDEGFAALTRIVMGIAHRNCGDRIVSVLEGGYTPEDLAGAVCAHVKTLLEYVP